MKYPIINKTWNQDSNSWSSRSLFICPFPWSANYQNFSRPQIRFITLDGPPPLSTTLSIFRISPSGGRCIKDACIRWSPAKIRGQYSGAVGTWRNTTPFCSVRLLRDALSSDVNAICIAWILPGRKNEISAPPLWWDFPIRGTGLDHSGFSRISFFFEIIFPRPLRFLRIFAAFWSLSLYGIRVSLRQGIWCLDYAMYYVMNNCDCNLSRRQIYKIRIMNNVIFEINSILECNLIFVSLEAHLSINHCFITILVLPILI